MDDPQELDEFNPNNPYTAIALLGERIKQLMAREREIERRFADKEKAITEREDNLEKRIAKIEASLGRGAGILIGLATIGTLGGFILAWGKTIFAPWTQIK